MENEFKPTSFTVHDALYKAFEGCRPRYAAGSVWKNARNPGERAFSSAFLDSLEGMGEIAGQNGFVMAIINGQIDTNGVRHNGLPLNELIAIHCMYQDKHEFNRWGVPIVCYKYEAALHAMSIVIEGAIPSVENRELRDLLVARCFGINQGSGGEVAKRIGIHEVTLYNNFSKVKDYIKELKTRSMIMAEEMLLKKGIILQKMHEEIQKSA